MIKKEIASGVAHRMSLDLRKALASAPQALAAYQRS